MRIANIAWFAAFVAMQLACRSRQTEEATSAPQRTVGSLDTTVELPPEPSIGSAEEAQEPPLHYRVELGGRTLRATNNQTTKAQGSFSDPTLTISVLEYRYLRRRGVTVPFPSYYSFEADLDEPVSWTLSGNDFKIMLFDYGSGPAPMRETVERTIKQFGDKVVQRGSTSLELNGAKLSGETLAIQLVGHLQRYDVYALPGKRAQLLILLDSPPDGETESKERSLAMTELHRAFRVER